MDRIPSLDLLHARFAGSRQEEPADCVFLAARGHPLAPAYRVAREFFDALTWRASHVGRMYAYRDESNCVEVTPPTLTLTWDPRGFQEFGKVYPGMGPPWTRYLEAAAEAGFPPEVAPSGHLGSWCICAADPHYQAAIREALKARGIEWRPVNDRVVRRCFDLRHYGNVREAVAEALGDWILPAYSPPPPAEDTPDLRAVPPAPAPALPEAPDLFSMLL